MLKRKIRILIPLLIIAGFLVYTWANIIIGNNLPFLTHYTGLILFLPLVYYFVNNPKRALLFTGIYLLIGICNLLTITPSFISYNIGIGRDGFLMTPSFQPLSFLIFIVYIVLNFDALVHLYYDYKDAKAKK